MCPRRSEILVGARRQSSEESAAEPASAKYSPARSIVRTEYVPTGDSDIHLRLRSAVAKSVLSSHCPAACYATLARSFSKSSPISPSVRHAIDCITDKGE